MLKIKRKYLKISGWVLVVVSSVLIVREIKQYDKLPGLNDPICQVADFFKYKEDAISNGFVWAGLLFVGLIMCLLSRKIKE